MQVAVHEWGRRKPAFGVQRPGGVDVELRADPYEPAVLGGEVDQPFAQPYISNEEVHRATVNR